MLNFMGKSINFIILWHYVVNSFLGPVRNSSYFKMPSWLYFLFIFKKIGESLWKKKMKNEQNAKRNPEFFFKKIFKSIWYINQSCNYSFISEYWLRLKLEFILKAAWSWRYNQKLDPEFSSRGLGTWMVNFGLDQENQRDGDRKLKILKERPKNLIPRNGNIGFLAKIFETPTKATFAI